MPAEQPQHAGVGVSPRGPSRARCQVCAIQFSWLTLVINGALAMLKTVIGLMAASRALIASALYSVNDVLSAVIVMISVRAARQPADDDHAYGHGKAEFVAIGVLSTVLAVAVILVLVYSVVDVMRGVSAPPHLIALPVAAVTMATNEFLARRGFCAARRVESPVIATAAEHNRADAVSSLAAMIGIGGALAGLHWLDPAVAIFETVHIVYLSGSLLGHALRGLMDSALAPGAVESIKRACCKVKQIRRVVHVRTRQAGPYAWADIAVEVSPNLSIDATNALRREVKRRARAAVQQSLVIQVRFKAAADPTLTPDVGRGGEAAAGARHG